MTSASDCTPVAAAVAVTTAAEAAVLYGTFTGADAAKAASKAEFEWEQLANPWALFLNSVLLIGKNIVTLLLLFWTLLRGAAAKENLMSCDPSYLSVGEHFGCEYTKAWVRSFPLLAAVVVLVLALRLMVQQRIYYGFLKVGGLLDFKNVVPYKDPLVLLLCFSILHAVAHFTLKLCDARGDLQEEVVRLIHTFFAPYVVFMVFLYSSYDVESLLIPLNKYVEEDPCYAKQMLGNIAFLKEDVVRMVLLDDVVAAAAGAQGASIDAVYREVIERYPVAEEKMPDDGEEVFHFLLNESLWPGRLLIDARLVDEKSTSFRHMFTVFMVILSVLQVFVVALLMEQALRRDLYRDVYLHSHYMDGASAVVLLLHVGFVLWMLSVTLWPVLSDVTADNARHLASIAKTAAEKAKRQASTATTSLRAAV